jgi:2-polyprenyl-3-methyl-5-hydroxy-6-metoxy-1,4-benzoquinol methylase
MEPQAFVAEVYRRMQQRAPGGAQPLSLDEMCLTPAVKSTIANYRDILPEDKGAPILDIGFGNGWFIAAALSMGYQNVYGAEYGVEQRRHIYNWSPFVKNLYEVESSIGDFLKDKPESFAFIHLSHVIEHVPKYHLLFVVDAVYRALKVGGTALLRTPNMEGPCALSCFYVTLGHEYGFTGSNLRSLLELCNFEDIWLGSFPQHSEGVRQWIGSWLRRRFLTWQFLKHRLFGVNQGGVFGQELVISGRRGDRPPLFHERFR